MVVGKETYFMFRTFDIDQGSVSLIQSIEGAEDPELNEKLRTLFVVAKSQGSNWGLHFFPPRH